METWDSEAWKTALDWHNSQPRPDSDEAFQAHVTDALGYDYLHPNSDEWSPFYGGSLNDFLAISEGFAGLTDSTGRMLSVRAGFIVNTAPDAFASRDAKHHYVGVSVSLFMAILDIAAYVLSQKEIFPAIGDPSQERCPRYEWGEIAGFYPARAHMAGHRIHPWYYESRLPRDPVRRSAALAMTITMMRYVWLHEFMHCVLGHVGFIEASGNPASLREVASAVELIGLSRANNVHRARALRHAMELDADWHALRASMLITTNGDSNKGVAGWDAGTGLIFTIFGAYLATWLFEQQQTHIMGQQAANHPDPAVRARHLMSRASEEFPQLGDIERLLPRWLSMVVDGIPHDPPPPIYPEAETISHDELRGLLTPYHFIAL